MTELPPPEAACAACAARDQVIAELGRAVEELRAEVAELRRWLGRNSGNSWMPPSADDLPSGRLPSYEVTQGRLDIRSYIDTARKHSQDVLSVLRDAITGAPWRPPIPAAAPT